jgi:hypothetical protein
VELLEPIMAGAGIIYVVDASKPYGEEYEAEMEILRWTGQPSMALINHIDAHDYSDVWKRALGGYFQIIRTFNPMESDRQQQVSVLESMAQLREEWTVQVKDSIALFERYHEMMLERSAAVIAKLLYHALSHVEKYPLRGESASEAEKLRVVEAYKARLRAFEAEAQTQIDRIWHHRHLQKSQQLLHFEGMDLFSEESASLFGLTRKELAVTGAATGAATGAGIDLLFAGYTLFIGGAVGAVAGGLGAWFAFDELSEVKLLGQRLGRHYLETGPVKNRNFPYILLGRILYYTATVATLSHARRAPVELKTDTRFKAQWLDDTAHQKLEILHKAFRSPKAVDEEMLHTYEAVILDSLYRLINAIKK